MSRAAAAMPAVVLATRPLGEADLLVVLLTPEYGKVRAAARNARKSKRRFAGGLSGGAVGQATLVRRPGSLWRLDGFVPILDHAAVGRDLTRFAYVAYLCELTDALVVEPEPDPRLFAALATAVQTTVRDAPDPGVLRWYELALLSALGLVPALVDCAVCGARVRGGAVAPEDGHAAGPAMRFDLARGGVLCTVHGAGAAQVLPQRLVDAAAGLADAATPPRWSAAAGPVDATDIAPPVSTRKGLRDLLRAVVRPHLRRPLRSLEFFAGLPQPVDPPGDPTREASDPEGDPTKG